MYSTFLRFLFVKNVQKHVLLSFCSTIIPYFLLVYNIKIIMKYIQDHGFNGAKCDEVQGIKHPYWQSSPG